MSLATQRMAQMAARMKLSGLRLFSTAQLGTPENPRMLTKILIANRGEIACRVMRTAERLGVRTVAVYSDADRNAMHKQMANEAIHIGPAPSSQSYLQMQRIIDAAQQTGAQGIHPGYGFLSENADFAQLCESNSVRFIGPPASAIVSMGSKSESKEIMEHSGVPIIKGYHGEDQSFERLEAEAEQIGYPVLIKAVKGGGGKGMRVVKSRKDLRESLDMAQSEARKHFGDDRVLIERYIQKPRHVEVQVFADMHGNVVHLYERDCSLQRRHQKVIEEAPAPGLSPELREELGQAACRAAKAVNYVGAGTVEFIFDTETNEFFFMEMNTRLQVEHPVTEMITNTDLVEWQLLAASGYPIPVRQEDIPMIGHAFEARIYAEDPNSNFLPGSGPLHFVRTPSESDTVRVETGARQGDDVTVHYDPMIAKLVVSGSSRQQALAKLIAKLGEYHIVGLKTNVDFLKNCAAHPAFANAELSTDFIDKHESQLIPKISAPPPRVLVQAALASIFRDASAVRAEQGDDVTSPWGSSSFFRVNSHAAHNLTLVHAAGVESEEDERSTAVTVTCTGPNSYRVELDGHSSPLSVEDCVMDSDGIIHATIDGYSCSATVAMTGSDIHVFSKDDAHTVSVQQPAYLSHDAPDAHTNAVSAPMNGTVVKVTVAEGDTVEKDQTVVVMEAMKMELVLRAPFSGKVTKLKFASQDLVNQGDVLVEIEPEESS